MQLVIVSNKKLKKLTFHPPLRSIRQRHSFSALGSDEGIPSAKTFRDTC